MPAPFSELGAGPQIRLCGSGSGGAFTEKVYEEEEGVSLMPAPFSELGAGPQIRLCGSGSGGAFTEKVYEEEEVEAMDWEDASSGGVHRRIDFYWEQRLRPPPQSSLPASTGVSIFTGNM